MSDLIDALIYLFALGLFVAVAGRPFLDNSTLIALTDGDLYEEGDA